MKKTWETVELCELNINATEQAPTNKIEIDLFQNGRGYLGASSNPSGTREEVPYYPN